MQIAMIGLGRMGANMARRLLSGGHEVVVHDRKRESVDALAALGAVPAHSLADVVQRLDGPRVAWIMVPAGAPTEDLVRELGTRFSPGDVVVDGGNSRYQDDLLRSAELARRGIEYLDVGTSGGVHGLERGYCLMIGGSRAAFQRVEPALRTLAPGRSGIEPTGSPTGSRARGGSAEEGYLHCGPAGAGHFVKMIHNGIEYGLMQAYAEGFDILRSAAREELPAERRYDFDVAAIAELWRRGSVVSSWLLDLTAAALAEDPRLEGYEGHVPDSGEGRWTVEAAIEESVPADVLTAALYARFRSRQTHTFAEKILSAMRAQFGGHAERPDS